MIFITSLVLRILKMRNTFLL